MRLCKHHAAFQVIGLMVAATIPLSLPHSEDGTVWSGGLNDAGQLGHSPDAESVAVRISDLRMRC